MSDEPVCLLLDGKTFVLTKSEANNAQKVKEKLHLPYEPSYVLKLGKEERVEFGNLEADKTYRLVDETMMNNQKHHVQNALMISCATYKDDHIKYLTESSTNHSVHTVCATSENSDQRVVVAVGEVKGKNTLYVAYRGTKTWKDAIDDIDLQMTQKDTCPGGIFHSGFCKRAATVSIAQIMYCAEKERCQTIVTCGHSLGGAVSSIAAIDLMQRLDTASDITVKNITFGAPFFANEIVRKICNADTNMLHYVGHQDVVPGLLSLSHTVQVVQDKLNKNTGGLYGLCSNFLSEAKSLTSLVLENIPYKETDDKTDIQIFGNLVCKILQDLQSTELGKDYSLEEYVPIGNFYIMENDKISPILAGNSTPNLQELVLKDAIKRSSSLGDIKKGHNLNNYYCANLRLINKMKPFAKQDVTKKTFLGPHQDYSASIFLKKETSDWNCTLIIKGLFLQNVRVMPNPTLYPFSNEEKIEISCNTEGNLLVISENISEERKDEVMTEEAPYSGFKVLNNFGELSVEMKSPKNSEMESIPDILCEPVSVIITKSLLRCLVLNNLKDGEAMEAAPTFELTMKTKWESLLKELSKGLDVQFMKLCNTNTLYSQKKCIDAFSMEIMKDMTQDLKLHYKGNLKWFFKKRKKLDEYSLKQLKKIFSVFSHLFAAIYTIYILIIGTEVEADYNEQLASVLREMTDNSNITLVGENDQKILELQAIVEKGDIKEKHSIVMEKILDLLCTKMKSEEISFDSLLEHLRETCRAAVRSKIKMFQIAHQIRQLYSKQCFIGFVGPQNAGKSTLLNKLYGVNAKAGMRVHTSEPTKYNISHNTIAIDFPGSDSLEDYNSAFKDFGFMNNFFVYVIPYSGTPSTSLIQNVKSAYRTEKISGKTSKTLFCINKCATVQSSEEKETFDEKYKTNFVEKIKESIKRRDETNDINELLAFLSENDFRNFPKMKELREKCESVEKELEEYILTSISEDDFIFTDWEIEAADRGIQDHQEVRKRIETYKLDVEICCPIV